MARGRVRRSGPEIAQRAQVVDQRPVRPGDHRGSASQQCPRQHRLPRLRCETQRVGTVPQRGHDGQFDRSRRHSGRRRSDPPCRAVRRVQRTDSDASVSANRRAPSQVGRGGRGSAGSRPGVGRVFRGSSARPPGAGRRPVRDRRSTAELPSSPRPRCWCRPSVIGDGFRPHHFCGRQHRPGRHRSVDPMKGRSRELRSVCRSRRPPDPSISPAESGAAAAAKGVGCDLRPHRTRRGPSGTQPAATTRRSWGAWASLPTAARPAPPPE